MERLPSGRTPQGDEHGAIQDLSALPDFFIAGVQEDVAAGFKRASAPAFQFGVEAGGALADLGGADRLAAELFDDGRDLAGGNALNVHFGQGEFEGLFTADALLEGGGIEAQIAPHWGTWNWMGPLLVRRVLGLKPLAWPRRASVRS